MPRIIQTQSELLDAIRACAASLGRTPPVHLFLAHCKMGNRQYRKFFPRWNDAIVAAGLRPNKSDVRIPPPELLTDWANVARKLGRVPTLRDYDAHGAHGRQCFHTTFGPWTRIPALFKKFAACKKEWADVVRMLPSTPSASAPQSRTRSRHNLKDLFGEPCNFRQMRHEPKDELSVILLFGMVAGDLGYVIEQARGSFPDCIAKRRISPGRWELVRIEFEFESRNFQTHRHNPDGCDLIICWKHNWPACPPRLEVLELSTEIKRLPDSRINP